MAEDSDLAATPEPPQTPICAIGASAGGVSALQDLFRRLPIDLDLAYVVIVHLSPDHPSAMDEILGASTAMPVTLVLDRLSLLQNHVYVIPPNGELVIQGDRLAVRPFSEPRSHRAPIDMFFRSVASARGDGIAVILTGAGSDGSLGIRAVNAAGGVVMAQEPDEAEYPMMPQNAIATGVVDIVAPIAELARRISEVARSKEAVRSLDFDRASNDLRRIVGLLRGRTGHDFSSYKRPTVMRRVMRRMQVRGAESLGAYEAILRDTPDEAGNLFSDLLISVTSFFREPAAFATLIETVIRPLLDEVGEAGLRVWVVGCATGEEAYSLVIAILEEARRRKALMPLQIFASDLDDAALAIARDGRYPRSIETDLSEERLRRFFVDEGTHYRVRKEVRDAVLFASHSVLKDPPFTQIDLISCRNLLIYLERSVQQQIGAVFHYSLRPQRYLFLGPAETAETPGDLFVPIEREARIYQSRLQAAHPLALLPQFGPVDRPASAVRPARGTRIDNRSLSTALHTAALERAAPPSVLVDERHNVIHLSPTAGRFILHSAGPPSINLPIIVRPELRLDLKTALKRAIEQRLPTITHPTMVDFDGEFRRVAFHVAPVSTDDQAAAQALVSFLEGVPSAEILSDTELRSDEVQRLHGELKTIQDALAVSHSEHDLSIEDLRAANEELQSINEEYRSTAEELETSKEELQSINEELQTVNAELKTKLETLSTAHSDLQNLTAATEIGTLFLDPELRIRMYTAPILELFNVFAGDIGRPITNFTHKLDYRHLERDVRGVLRTLTMTEAEIRSGDGHWYLMRVRPYRMTEHRVGGAVLTFVDISDRLEAERALRDSEERQRALIGGLPQLVWRAAPDGRFTWASQQWAAYTGQSASESQGLGWMAALHPEDRSDTLQAWSAAATQTTFQTEHRLKNGIHDDYQWFRSQATALRDDADAIVEWVGTSTDIDDLRRAVR